MSAITLTNVNVWLDMAFLALWLVVICGLVAHFIISIPKGRFRKKWIEKQWPKHDWAPPAAPKLLHFGHLAMMGLLGFSGMYIRFPFFDGGRTPMRYVHYVAMIIVAIIFFARVWYAFFSKERDYKEFAVGKKDLQSTLGVAAYYAYFSNAKPHVAKYNVMQKLSYDLFALLMLVQGFTGFALVTSPFIFGASPRDIFVGWWLGPLVGGTAMAGAIARLAHFSVNWLFIIITTVHFYLAVAEDLPCSMDFFGIKKLTVYPDAHAHHDDHGSHDSGAGAPVIAASAVEAE